MLKLCNSFIVVVHIILLFHIAHTFVLLTANIDDVKKIARKFVSDELADKIADFIARATESMSNPSRKTSEENITENSQVSAENRMYNVERHGFESFAKVGEKPKSETDKQKAKTSEKKEADIDYIDTKIKSKKETKPKSRYIIESAKISYTIDKDDEKDDKNDKQMDSIKKHIKNLIGANDKPRIKTYKKTKLKKKTKVKPYKLLSTYDVDEANAVKDGTGSKEKKTDEEEKTDEEKKTDEDKRSHRSFDDEIAAIKIAAQEYDDDDFKKAAKPSLVKDKFDNENEIINKSGKITKSNSLITEKNEKEVNWWEKDLPKHKQDGDANHKTWF